MAATSPRQRKTRLRRSEPVFVKTAKTLGNHIAHSPTM
jgi:hypothetical protein